MNLSVIALPIVKGNFRCYNISYARVCTSTCTLYMYICTCILCTIIFGELLALKQSLDALKYAPIKHKKYFLPVQCLKKKYCTSYIFHEFFAPNFTGKNFWMESVVCYVPTHTVYTYSVAQGTKCRFLDRQLGEA